MWDNSEMGSNLNDWINILATFILEDIIKCHGLQTNDSEMNQRINHLVFVLKGAGKLALIFIGETNHSLDRLSFHIIGNVTV